MIGAGSHRTVTRVVELENPRQLDKTDPAIAVGIHRVIIDPIRSHQRIGQHEKVGQSGCHTEGKMISGPTADRQRASQGLCGVTSAQPPQSLLHRRDPIRTQRIQRHLPDSAFACLHSLAQTCRWIALSGSSTVSRKPSTSRGDGFFRSWRLCVLSEAGARIGLGQTKAGTRAEAQRRRGKPRLACPEPLSARIHHHSTSSNPRHMTGEWGQRNKTQIPAPSFPCHHSPVTLLAETWGQKNLRSPGLESF